jgi:integral membrane protein
MKAIGVLPEDYGEIYSLNLQKDKRTAIIVNLLALAIAAVMAVSMNFFVPVTSFFDMSGGIVRYFLRLAALIVLMVLYMVLHELVHGIAMKLCGTKRVKYGFTGLYAFAGSEDYYDKKSYIFIALAPIVLWGTVLAAVNFFVPTEWFWIVYMIQLINISGAAGDLFAAVKFSRMPKNILIQDSGVSMRVFYIGN